MNSTYELTCRLIALEQKVQAIIETLTETEEKTTQTTNTKPKKNQPTYQFQED